VPRILGLSITNCVIKIKDLHALLLKKDQQLFEQSATDPLPTEGRLHPHVIDAAYLRRNKIFTDSGSAKCHAHKRLSRPPLGHKYAQRSVGHLLAVSVGECIATVRAHLQQLRVGSRHMVVQAEAHRDQGLHIGAPGSPYFPIMFNVCRHNPVQFPFTAFEVSEYRRFSHTP
jgi:hypothetical protein